MTIDEAVRRARARQLAGVHRARPIPTPDLIEEIEHLLSYRIPPAEIATRLGLTAEATVARLKRADRTDLAAAFKSAAWTERRNRAASA